jgi:hypothetical protein
MYPMSISESHKIRNMSNSSSILTSGDISAHTDALAITEAPGKLNKLSFTLQALSSMYPSLYKHTASNMIQALGFGVSVRVSETLS